MGDALLVYLSVYRYSDACDATPAQIKENLARIWDEITVLTKDQAVEVVLEPHPDTASPLTSLTSLTKGKLNLFNPRPSELRVVFLHEYKQGHQRLGGAPMKRAGTPWPTPSPTG